MFDEAVDVVKGLVKEALTGDALDEVLENAAAARSHYEPDQEEWGLDYDRIERQVIVLALVEVASHVSRYGRNW